MSKELSIERMKSCALKNKNRNNKKINLTVVAHVGLTFSNRFVLKRETTKKNETLGNAEENNVSY